MNITKNLFLFTQIGCRGKLGPNRALLSRWQVAMGSMANERKALAAFGQEREGSHHLIRGKPPGGILGPFPGCRLVQAEKEAIWPFFGRFDLKG